MKTLAIIKNELFKDYVKIISTENLAETLDNPAVPVPFTCVLSVENQNSDALASELNQYFSSKKMLNKDFLAVQDDDVQQMSFLFNLIQLSSVGSSVANTAVKKETKFKEQINVEVKAEPIKELTQEAQIETTTELTKEEQAETSNESFGDTVEEMLEAEQPTTQENNSDIIESLGVPINSTIMLVKDEKITAKIIDEKTIEFEGEVVAIVDGTKKAFKKAGVTGMALGLANWNYNGQSLKSLKDNK